jgi:hypothetical protein
MAILNEPKYTSALMSQDIANTAETLRAKILAAFPDTVFSGSITTADGRFNEYLDEEEALYESLHDKKWSDIPTLFLKQFANRAVLLTPEAFVAFLPAWLMCAFEDEEVRSYMVYSFNPDTNSHQQLHESGIQRTIQAMGVAQRDTLKAFLTYCVEVERSAFVKNQARRALEFVSCVK